VLIWWIIWLWRDEPGDRSGEAAGALALVGSPVGAVPPPLEAQIPESEQQDGPDEPG